MAEIPAVIVDAQRSGPSTGMPTKTEQSDLNHALFGGHGEAPRVVMAPTSVEDCFHVIVEAFNAAEKYQVPVIVLSDQSLSHRLETVPRPDLDSYDVAERVSPNGSAQANGSYKRYEIHADGVSPMAVPGGPGAYVSTGIEHDEAGNPHYEPELHTAMMSKRFRKLEPLADARGARDDHRPRAGRRRHPRLGIDRGRRARGGRDLPRSRAEGLDLLPARAGARCRSSASAAWAAGMGRVIVPGAERDRPVRAARARRRGRRVRFGARRRPGCRSPRRRSRTT